MRTVDTGLPKVNAAIDEVWRLLGNMGELDRLLTRYRAETSIHVRPPQAGEVRISYGDQTLEGDLLLLGDWVISGQPGVPPVGIEGGGVGAAIPEGPA